MSKGNNLFTGNANDFAVLWFRRTAAAAAEVETEFHQNFLFALRVEKKSI